MGRWIFQNKQKNNVDTTSPITHVSLCAGYGGIDLGLKRAIPSLRTIAFSEIEAFACANLVAKMEAGLLDPAPVWTDLKTFPWAEFHGRVDICSFGYPCQPFSAAGKRLGAEDPRHLWPFIAAGIARMRPSICFAENVEGHISLGLPDVLQDLGRMGYRTTWCVASASECGAPHQRKRVFILAYDQRQRLEGFHQLGAAISGQDEGLQLGHGCSGEELANGHGQRGQLSDQWRFAAEQMPFGNGSTWRTPWPSRPGEQQYQWEPPRVVGNAEAAGRRQDVGSVAASRQGEQKERQQWWSSSSNPVDPDSAMDDAASMRSTEPADGRGQATPRADASSDEDLGNAQDPNRWTGDGPAQAGAGPDSEWRRRLGESSAGAMGQPKDGHPSGHPLQLRQGQAQHRGASGCVNEGRRQAEPTLGRDPDGPTHRLDDAVLHVSTDNRTDELRLLGNGVVPATAERAFRVLFSELSSTQPHTL
jgi:DNA (cytosine-5)-methyltransferase 1